MVTELTKDFPGLKSSVIRDDVGRRPTMMPFEVSEDADIVHAVSGAYEKVRGVKQSLGPKPPYCYYGTDAAHLLHRGEMEGIVCGPGGKYNTMPNERVDISDYLDAIRIYLLTILTVCGRV